MGAKYTPLKCKEHPGWYEIPGFSGYCANRAAQVLNKKTGNFSSGGDAGRYLRVSAYKDDADKPTLCYLHDLICRAFKGPPEEKHVVLHWDDNRFNNVPSNLFWGTQSQNIKKVYENGLRISREDYPAWLQW